MNIAIALFVVIPGCFFLSRNTLAAGRVDQVLLVYLAAELLVVVVLSRANTGAWLNYAIQAIVFGSILTARAVDRARDLVASTRASLPFILGAAIVCCNVINSATETAGNRLYGQMALARIFENYGRPTSEFFFVSRPGDNRLYGQPALVYDDWLYPVFESIHLAEPRSIWLSRALAKDGINYIVATSESTTIDGLGRSMCELGYHRGIQVGTFVVWERSGFMARSH